MVTAILSTKGQLVIPSPIRKSLNLRPGDEVALSVDGQRLILERKARPRARLKKGKFGRLVLIAPPGAPPITAAVVREILEEGT